MRKFYAEEKTVPIEKEASALRQFPESVSDKLFLDKDAVLGGRIERDVVMIQTPVRDTFKPEVIGAQFHVSTRGSCDRFQ